MFSVVNGAPFAAMRRRLEADLVVAAVVAGVFLLLRRRLPPIGLLLLLETLHASIEGGPHLGDIARQQADGLEQLRCLQVPEMRLLLP